ncbi:class I SAM-dependent methyltransferase [Tistrella mobilis]|uniref:class I SAM-dependent methyltransferase n=1 Tax=Tistrella mobilis TaxID=171437 RepID=UPI003558A395
MSVAALIDHAGAILVAGGLLDQAAPFDEAAYQVAVAPVETGFVVPATTISGLMRRFLFHVAAQSGAAAIYGAGTHVGFAFAFLALGRAQRPGRFQASAIDIDPAATRIAADNARLLPPDLPLVCRTADAVADLAADTAPIGLLFIDVDDPETRKGLYPAVLAAARPRLQPGALILAHDPLVPQFAQDFAAYHGQLRGDAGILGPVVLPLDECGLSVARVVS